VHRCFKPGRSRLDHDLVVDIARVLLDDEAAAAEWRQAHLVVTRRAADAAVVQVRATLPANDSAFTGREAELAGILEQSAGGLIAIDSMAGVGNRTTKAASSALDPLFTATQ
jgi:hypothetical protein